MTLKITIQQPHKKPKTVNTPLTIGIGGETGPGLLTVMRKLWEVEQILNSLPGADLKVSVDVL
jgi:hypothetical protein